MVQCAYHLKRICGAVYNGGDIAFGAGAGGRETLYSAVGARVIAFDVDEQQSRALPFEARARVSRLCASRSGELLVVVDADGRTLVVHARRRVVLHRFDFMAPVAALAFSPDDGLLAAATRDLVRVWLAPRGGAGAAARAFTPFTLVRTFRASHAGAVTSLDWSPDCGSCRSSGGGVMHAQRVAYTCAIIAGVCSPLLRIFRGLHDFALRHRVLHLSTKRAMSDLLANRVVERVSG